MSHFALTLGKLPFDRGRVLAMLRPHARPLALACGLAAALLVWSVPAATETRCMLARQAALGWQAAISLSITLTALSWYVHEPVLHCVRAIGRRFARD